MRVSGCTPPGKEIRDPPHFTGLEMQIIVHL